MVTILTDIADYPPHFWMEAQDQYVICGSDRAVEQARAIGLPRSHVFHVSGMILQPKFYSPRQPDRMAERARLGLLPDLPTGLVMFGGEGSTKMVHIARHLNQSGLPLQLILLCGKNDAVAAQLRALPKHIPMLVQGFTRDVPHYMSLADFFIGKAGPGSISEALAMRLPVIVEKNAWTLAHERFNADWIEQRKFGIVVPSFSRISEAVRQMLCAENHRTFRERAAATSNRAVFEIPELLERLLARNGSARTPRDSAPACVPATPYETAAPAENTWQASY